MKEKNVNPGNHIIFTQLRFSSVSSAFRICFHIRGAPSVQLFPKQMLALRRSLFCYLSGLGCRLSPPAPLRADACVPLRAVRAAPCPCGPV
eukprot:9311477-Pyramimonas_sp.AAC.1